MTADVNIKKGRSATAQAGSLSMEDIVEILRNRIVEHELPPGSKLREAALTVEFNVSRPRVREAFGILEERGLIERIPNRGAVVTRLKVDEAFALFEVREVLEGLAVRLATEKSSPDTWKDMVELFGKPVEEAMERGELDFYVDCVTEFRRRTTVAANNLILAALLDSLYDRTKMLVRRLVLVPGRASKGMCQHQETLRAMSDGNAELAEQLKRKNIRSARDSFDSYKKYLL
jgi:DNA-binding GntR family transcriptional regulator